MKTIELNMYAERKLGDKCRKDVENFKLSVLMYNV